MNINKINKLYEEYNQLERSKNYYERQIADYEESIEKIIKLTNSFWYKIINVFRRENTPVLLSALLNAESSYKRELAEIRTKLFDIKMKLEINTLPVSGEILTAEGLVNIIYGMKKVK